MVHAIAANLPVRSLDLVSIGTGIVLIVSPPDLHRGGNEPACVQGTHPACERVGLGDLHLTPAMRAKQGLPRVEAQSWRAEIISGMMHHALHLLAVWPS